ncbi:uncharacterized protein K441DRAFT_664378 [Cenococcum geophilum 1.58]|uniref:uncharacterized protein n=1 Tax=Cenococcum geophilum 1.58 TaxID=794803 RepID=UPI00358E8A12|nr:hypothetical protein K441DRAFT_664378 [Cenococcum geophilum 1.58]
MHLQTKMFLLLTFSLPAFSGSPNELAQRAEKSIIINKGSNYDMITEIKKSQINIENLCCYECGNAMCCCNFDPTSERCNEKGCVPAG